MSLSRSDIKEMGEYVLNGAPVIVFMIHKPCSGESVTLAHRYPHGANPHNYLLPGTMQMRKFMKQASKKDQS